MTGSWLSGPRAALPQGGDGTDDRYRGERLGLPQHGAGSLAGPGRRVAAITIDWLLATGLGYLFTAPADPGYWRVAVWAALSTLSVAVLSTTAGQAAVGIGVARIDAPTSVGLLRSVIRVVLIFLVVPPLVWDTDGRGLHDRLTGTAVIRSR